MNTKQSDQYSEPEAEQRFKKLVRAALNTSPKPLRSITPKGVPAQSKKHLSKKRKHV